MADSVLVDLPYMESACFFPSLESLLRYCTTSFLADASTDSDRTSPNCAPSSPASSTPTRTLPSRPSGSSPRSPSTSSPTTSATSSNSSPPSLPPPPPPQSPLRSSLPSSPSSSTPPSPSGRLSHSSRLSSDTSASAAAAPPETRSTPTRLPVFGELVKVWTVRNLKGRCPFQVLFPLVRDEARQKLMKEGCSVSFLAGVVVAEAFLLRLCLKVKGAEGVPRSQLQKELSIWMNSSISVFKNQQFFGVVLNMLENPPLPVYSPLSADDEILVREVLYDALILLDNSVLSGAEVDQADSSHFPIVVRRLVITVNAINDAINEARLKGEEGKAMSYFNAFLTSNIPTHPTSLASLAICQADTDQLVNPIATTTPKAFLNLEDKGLKVFGENCSRIKERLMHDEGKNDNQSRISQSDADLVFIGEQSHQEGMDTKGGDDEEAVEMETTDDAFMPAAHSMKVMANGTSMYKAIVA